MAWPKRKDQPTVPPPGSVVFQTREISRAEIRLYCLDHAMKQRVSGMQTKDTIAIATEFFAWVVEETAEAK